MNLILPIDVWHICLYCSCLLIVILICDDGNSIFMSNVDQPLKRVEYVSLIIVYIYLTLHQNLRVTSSYFIIHGITFLKKHLFFHQTHGILFFKTKG